MAFKKLHIIIPNRLIKGRLARICNACPNNPHSLQTSASIPSIFNFLINQHFYIILFIIWLSPMLVFSQTSSYSKFSKRSTVSPSPFLDSAKRVMVSNPSKAFNYIEKALTISISNGDKVSEASCYESLGSINKSLTQYDLALNYFHKAETIYKTTGDAKKLNNIHQILGDTYKAEGNYTKSIEYYKLSQKYIDKKGTSAEKAQIKNKLADVYNVMGQPDKAISAYKDVLELEEDQNNARGIASTQNNIGDNYKKSNQKTKALAAYKKSEEVAKESGDNDMLVQSLQKQGEVYRSDRKYNDELKVRNAIIDISEKKQDKTILAEENREIGNIYVEKKETEKALPFIQKSIQLADETGNLEQKSKALQSLSSAYSGSYNYNLALITYKQYVETQDALNKQKESEIKKSYEVLASLAKQIQRLDLIEKELKISEQTVNLLQQEKLVKEKTYKAQRILSITMIITLVIVILASVLIFRSNIEKRKANQMLALKSLRSQMNPHFIYNSLNSVNNYISKSDEKSANKFLSDFSRLMRSVMDNSKHDFVPLSSELQIIDVYLKLEHSRFNDKFDYEFEINQDLETEQYLVPPMLIQPFIENAIWHGLRYRDSKGFLSVHISSSSEDILVTITDNGIGRKKSEELKTKNQKEHISTGLKNIENRISIINELYNTKIGLQITDIDDGNQTGTSVILTIPIKK
jgi:tetratricopeptide (TPR) repeat protein